MRNAELRKLSSLVMRGGMLLLAAALSNAPLKDFDAAENHKIPRGGVDK